MISYAAHFMYMLAISISSLEKCLFRCSLHFWIELLFFFFFFLSCMSWFCILDINLLLVTSYANIFSHSVGYFFFLCFVDGFLCCAKDLSLIRFHMEKEMAVHSSILAWRIPWTGEPGGLLSVGLHRVRHDWSNLACLYWRGKWQPTPVVLSGESQGHRSLGGLHL